MVRAASTPELNPPASFKARMAGIAGAMCMASAITRQGRNGSLGARADPSFDRRPSERQAIWVAMSTVSIFYSSDGGESWEARNRGTRNDYMPEGQDYPEFGQCVHSLVMAPDAHRLAQQNHCGMYRSDDGARSGKASRGCRRLWLPGGGASKRPRNTLSATFERKLDWTVYTDEKAAVWRTRDGGGTWQDCRQGLPQTNAFFGVLRQAMATDTLHPAGVYFAHQHRAPLRQRR